MQETDSTTYHVSQSLVYGLAEQLSAVLPFAQMQPSHVSAFVQACQEQYFEPGEVILEPGHGVPKYLYLIRQGAVSGHRVGEQGQEVCFELDAGDLFSVGAALTGRDVSTTYKALADCFCLLFPTKKIHEFGLESPPFLAFLKDRFGVILQKSHQNLQQHFAAQAAQAQLHQNTLGSLIQREPISVPAQTPLRQALELMEDRRIGSMLVIDEHEVLQGILTRHDLLSRVVLANKDLNAPISEVMSAPPKTLDVNDTVEMASHLMVHASIRHIPILCKNKVVGLVSERDLFSFQRFSIGSISASIRGAHHIAALIRSADHIRQYAKNLLSQGVTGHRLTGLVTYLNDLLTDRVIHLQAESFGVDPRSFCWVALGSEGREEQTIATDQDNALVLSDEISEQAYARFLKFARSVNEALDQCGYPLCKGDVMASNPAYCLRQRDWLKRCQGWIDAGAPQDLLDASIFFDFRPIMGNAKLVEPLQLLVEQAVANTPRFISLLARNALNWKVPLTFFGGFDTIEIDGKDTIDLKLSGTALIVDFARIYALAHKVSDRNTRLRLLAIAAPMGYDAKRAAEWVSSFEFLQTLRLKAQMAQEPVKANPNALDIATLSKVDRMILKAAFHVMREMQQRLELDYVR